jgi:hypothetical protein
MSEAIDRAALAIQKCQWVTCDGQTSPQNMARAALASIRQQILESGIDSGSVITWIDEMLR